MQLLAERQPWCLSWRLRRDETHAGRMSGGEVQISGVHRKGRLQRLASRGQTQAAFLTTTGLQTVDDRCPALVRDGEHQTARGVCGGVHRFLARIRQQRGEGQHMSIGQPWPIKRRHVELNLEALARFGRGHGSEGHGHEHRQQDEGQHPASSLVHEL